MNTDNERLKWWAVELLQIGKYKAATLLALHCYQQSFSACKTEELLESVLLLGKCLVQQDMHQQALQCMKDAEEYVKDVELDPRITGDALWAIGELYYGLGHVTEAKTSFLKHAGMLENLYGPDHIRCSDVYTILSDIEAREGKFEAAIMHASRALRIREKHFGKNNAKTASSYYNIGLLYRSLGLLDNARSALSTALEIRKTLFGDYSLHVADVEIMLGYTQEQRAFYNDAKNRYRRTLRIRKKILGESRKQTKVVQNMIRSLEAKMTKKSTSNTITYRNEPLLTPSMIKNAIVHVNICVWIKNISIRCFLLNPYLQAELVYVSDIKILSLSQLKNYFNKHQDLLDKIFDQVLLSNTDEVIDSYVMLNAIKVFLETVTKKDAITSTMEEEIVSACPLQESKLRQLYHGDERLSKQLGRIISCSLKAPPTHDHISSYDSEVYMQRILIAICKINAKKLSQGSVAVISVDMTEKLLMGAYQTKLDADAIMKIISPKIEVGEAILEQLAVDDRRIKHAQNIRQHFDKQYLAPCDVFVAVTLIRELHPESPLDNSVILSLLDATRKRGVTLHDIITLIPTRNIVLRTYIVPLLQAVTFWEMERPFVNRREVISTSSSGPPYKNVACDAGQTWLSSMGQMEFSKTDQRFSLDQRKKPTGDTANARLLQLLCTMRENNLFNIPVEVIEDVAIGAVDSIEMLREKVEAGDYASYELERFLAVIPPRKGQAAKPILITHGEQLPSSQVHLQSSNRSNLEASPVSKEHSKITSSMQLDTIRAKYPHLSGAIDEIEDCLASTNKSNNIKNDGHELRSSVLGHTNMAVRRDSSGRRVKDTRVSVNELWKLCSSKLHLAGIMLNKLKHHKFKCVAVKLYAIGFFLKASWLYNTKKCGTKLLAVGIFHFLRHAQSNFSGFRLPNQGRTTQANERLTSRIKYKGPKLRGLHWTTVDEAKTKGTIWEGRKRTFSTVSHIFQDVEDVFAPTSTQRSKLPIKEKAKKTSVISLLDPKRTQNLSISLARVWSSPFSDLARAVKMLRIEELGLDRLEKLQNIIPTTEECNLLKNYTGEISKLNKADKFVRAMSTVKRLKPRLDAMVFYEKFHDTVSTVLDAASKINNASSEILSSNNFQELLGIVLSLGNKLNQNTRKQLAAGIKIDGLTKLAATRGKTGITVLEYMVQNLLSTKPEILEITSELPTLNSATSLNSLSMENDMKYLRRGLSNIQSQIAEDEKEKETYFVESMGKFYSIASDKFKAIDKEVEIAKKQYNRAAQWLFEDPLKTQPEQLFAKISKFISELEKTRTKIEAKRNVGHRKVVETNSLHGHAEGTKGHILKHESTERMLKSASSRIRRSKPRRTSIDAWKDE